MDEENLASIEAALYLEENAKLWAENGASSLSWLSYVLAMRGRTVSPLTLAASLHYRRLPLIAACCFGQTTPSESARA